MTDRPDPMRALDGIHPPDRWSEVERRAARDDVDLTLAAGRGRRPRALALAAAAMVLVAVGLAVVVGRSGDGSTTGSSADDLWGHRWVLLGLDVGGEDGGRVSSRLTRDGGKPIVLDARTEGQLALQVCNQQALDVHLDDDRLVVDERTTTAAACLDPLESLVRIDHGIVSVRDGELTIDRRSRPAVRSRWRRSDLVTVDDRLWGDAWVTTSVGGSPTRSTLDLTERDRIRLGTCGGPEAGAEVRDERLVVTSEWSTHRNPGCTDGPPAPEVEALLQAGPQVSFDGPELVLQADGTELRASRAEGGDGSVGELFGHRWLVVEARDRDRPLDLPGDLVLEATFDPIAVHLPGCLTPVGGPTEVVGSELHVDVAPPSPIGDCLYPPNGDYDVFFRELLGASPEAAVVADRATLSVPGRSLLLVRIA